MPKNFKFPSPTKNGFNQSLALKVKTINYNGNSSYGSPTKSMVARGNQWLPRTNSDEPLKV